MDRISKHFTIDEFECHCGCGQLIVKRLLVVMMEEFRAYLCEKYKKEVRINVHCVNRCQESNDELEGSVKNSTHVTGRGLDGHSDDITYEQLRESAIECHAENGILRGGLGFYPNWTDGLGLYPNWTDNRTYEGGLHFDIGRFREWGEK